MLDLPTRPQIVVRVGVTGHREISENVSRSLAQVVLAVLRSAWAGAASVHRENHPVFDGRTPLVRLLTQLAKGTDTIAARALLTFRNENTEVFELQPVLPFAPEVYESDFHLASQNQPDHAAINQLHELLRGSGRAFCLAGDYASLESRLTSYEAAGRVLLQQSDLLIVVLDPERKASRGGTRRWTLRPVLRGSRPCGSTPGNQRRSSSGRKGCPATSRERHCKYP